MRLYTQLNFGGNCEEAFRFYEKNLGGKITAMMTRAQLPDLTNAPPGPDKAIVHARMNIAGVELIGNDVSPEHFKPMRSAYLYFAVDSVAEAERVYGVLSQGGQVSMPLEETFFASRFSMLRDKFGVTWTIIHELQRQ